MATSTSNRPSRIRLGVGVELLFYLAIGSGNQRRYTFEALFPGCAISILLFAVLWIGGPFGATQALGEYLRPVSVERTGLVTLCEEKETPPPDLMRIVEAQRSFYHLTIQQVAVCGGFGYNKGMIASSAASDFHRYGVWRPLEYGCCTFQFRRHFEVLVPNEGGTVVVQAVLIQSRWDFLRLNWNKVHEYWFWPYAHTGR